MRVAFWKATNLFLYVLTAQIMVCITIALNIPFARQVICFFYLILVPGITILKIFKLHDLDFWEAILLSVGLSIAFLMLIGFLINELGLLLSISNPLSLVPLITVINGVTLFLCFLGCFINKDDFTVTKISKSYLLIILLTFLPVLSIAGAILVNAFQNNFLLLLLMVIISLLIVFISISKKLIFTKIYPIVLLMIAIALLFHASLISNYIYGADIKREYYLFKLTESNSYWNSQLSEYPTTFDMQSYDMENAMLSVTVLPTIFSTILNMEGVWVLKIVYPLIFSFVPLGLYKLYQRQMSKKAAFLSAFFFMSNGVFFGEMLGLARQMIAELFFVLLFFIILEKKMNKISKGACFMIFGAALVTSHYSISYLFMFLVFSTWISLSLLKRIGWTMPKGREVTTSFVLLFFVMLFAWNIYTSKSGAFNQFVGFANNIYRGITTEFFVLESRGQDVLRGIGLESSPSFLHSISRAFAYATEFFIVIGFITLLYKRKRRIVDQEFDLFLSLNMVLLALVLILPNLAISFNMTRFYHVLLFFLAPLCILGGEAIFSFLVKKLSLSRPKTEHFALSLILIVLIPYFLFETSFVYEVTGNDSWSLPLSKYRMGAKAYVGFGLVDELDVSGAEWLSQNLDLKRTSIYTDLRSRWTLIDYGMTDSYRIEVLSNTTTVLPNGTIYLGSMNTVYGLLLGGEGLWNTTEISSVLDNMNKIYSNGGSDIHS